jgi:hypothetical protein
MRLTRLVPPREPNTCAARANEARNSSALALTTIRMRDLSGGEISGNLFRFSEVRPGKVNYEIASPKIPVYLSCTIVDYARYILLSARLMLLLLGR